MTDYDFERVPSQVVKDTAEHGDPTASAIAKELLLMRNLASAADATANSLHKVITAIIKRHNGPASIWDFAAWIDGEFRRLRELDRLRAIEAAARDAMRQIDRTLWLEHETGFLHDLRNNARICDLRAALAAKEEA